nr:hypothetical protein [uncultured Duganella sp.]
MITAQPWLAVGAALAATAIREENILLLVWLLVFRRVGIAAGIAALAVAAGWLLLVRWWAPSLTPLKTMLLPPAYAALSVRVDGRAICSLYPFPIPLAVYARWPRAANTGMRH